EMVQSRGGGGFLAVEFRAWDGVHIEVARSFPDLEKRSRLLSQFGHAEFRHLPFQPFDPLLCDSPASRNPPGTETLLEVFKDQRQPLYLLRLGISRRTPAEFLGRFGIEGGGHQTDADP